MARGGRGGKPEKPKELGNTKFLDVVQERFPLLKDQIEEFLTNQSISAPQLLKFKGLSSSSSGQDNAGDEEQDQSENAVKQLKENALKIEQQIRLIRSVAQKVEKDLYLSENDKSGLSEEQKQELRLKTLQEQNEVYQNLEFNMNYQVRQKQSYNRYSTYENKQIQFFEGEQSNQQQSWLQINQYYSTREIQNQLRDDKNKNLQNIYLTVPSFVDEAEYFKFDDLLNSIFIDREASFNQISLNLPLENNLSVLSLLRFLMTIRSCNLLKISVDSSRLEEHFENISDLLETVFQVAFSIKNLQGFTLTAKHTILPHLVAGIRKVDATKSNLRAFYLQGDMRLANSNEIAELLSFCADIPDLYDFQADQWIVTGQQAERSFSQLLKRVKQINIKLHGIPRSFSFDLPLENVISLKLVTSFEPNQFNLRLLDTFLNSVKRATNLLTFSLIVGTEVTSQTHRRDILRDAQTKKEEEENAGATNGDNFAALNLFDHLSELTNLENFSFNAQANQLTYDSLLKLFTRNTRIQKASLRLNQSSNQFDLINLDLKNIMQILNNLTGIQSFDLLALNNQIKYILPNKLSTQYHFFQRINKDTRLTYNQTDFQLDRVNQIEINSFYQGYEEFDNMCKSIASCKNASKVKMSYQKFDDDVAMIKKKATSDSKLLFFKRFENLKQLQHLLLSIVFDQQMLESIESVVRNISLKSLILKREPMLQLYLNYTQLFDAVQNSKSIEQLYVQSNIELIKEITEASLPKWNQIKVSNYYRPAADLIRNAPPQLSLIDIDEKNCNDEGHLLVLKAYNSTPHMVYTKIHADLLREFQTKQEELVAELNTAISEGKIVNPSFRFPLAQTTFQSYSYW